MLGIQAGETAARVSPGTSETSPRRWSAIAGAGAVCRRPGRGWGRFMTLRCFVIIIGAVDGVDEWHSRWSAGVARSGCGCGHDGVIEGTRWMIFGYSPRTHADLLVLHAWSALVHSYPQVSVDVVDTTALNCVRNGGFPHTSPHAVEKGTLSKRFHLAIWLERMWINDVSGLGT